MSDKLQEPGQESENPETGAANSTENADANNESDNGFDPKLNAAVQNILKGKKAEANPAPQDDVPPGQLEIEQLRQQAKDMEERWKRAEADKQNLQRRFEQEKETIKDYAISSFARELTNVLDNLYRAVENTTAEKLEESPDLKHLYDGVILTQKELVAAFEKNGITRLVPLGEPFDHNFHEAMMQVDDASCDPNTVVQVLQAGYTIKSRLLRPAMVAVSKKPAAEAQ